MSLANARLGEGGFKLHSAHAQFQERIAGG